MQQQTTVTATFALDQFEVKVEGSAPDFFDAAGSAYAYMMETGQWAHAPLASRLSMLSTMLGPVPCVEITRLRPDGRFASLNPSPLQQKCQRFAGVTHSAASAAMGRA